MKVPIKRRNEKPDWLIDALRACRPPDDMTVTEFADLHELKDRENSIPFRSSLTPYLVEVLNAFIDPEVDELWFVKPTQVGGTRALFCMLAYVIAQDPDDAMIVYPTLDVARYTSVNRIQPMILANPTLRELYLPAESTDLELHFRNGMILVLAGANSASSLASRPIRYLFLDEVDKYPAQAGKEASPIKLAIERTDTFRHNRKIFGTSTPTFKTGNVWRAMERCDQVREYQFRCQSCGQFQVPRMKDADGTPRLRWPQGATAPEALHAAWYECESCHERMLDSHKPFMVKEGRWSVTAQRAPGRRKLAFRMNKFISPWARFGEMAEMFLASKDDPEELQNFINSWLAEPWEQIVRKTEKDTVFERRTEYHEGVVPEYALLLTGGVDYQPILGAWYWVVRAWGPQMTSQNIAHGIALSWTGIEEVMNRPWRKRNGEQLLVNLAGIDSGDETDEVYEFCANNQDWTRPTKGSSVPLTSFFRLSTVDRANNSANGLQLLQVDTDKYKSLIHARLNRPNGPGAWMVHADCDEDYANQITAEHKVPVGKGANAREKWQLKVTHGANHYLDAEVYAAAAADVLGVRFLDAAEDTPVTDTPGPSTPPPPQAPTGDQGFVPDRPLWRE